MNQVSTFAPTDMNENSSIQYWYLFLYTYKTMYLKYVWKIWSVKCSFNSLKLQLPLYLCVRLWKKAVFEPQSASPQLRFPLSCPWLERTEPEAEGWASPRLPSPKDTLQVASSSVCLQRKKKACPDTSEVWPSHRLLKQSPLINIYGLTDGRGSLVGAGGTEIVWRNNHHHPFTSTSSLSISLKWKWCF